MWIHIPFGVLDKAIIPATQSILDMLVEKAWGDPEIVLERMKELFPEGGFNLKIMDILAKILPEPWLYQEDAILGIETQSKTGLWAGIIKYVDQMHLWRALFPLFGSVTLWGITGREQVGNDFRPRSGRLTLQASGWNAFWLPNDGVDKTAAKLEIARIQWKLPQNLFINICNSLTVADEESKVNEMGYMVEKLFPYTQLFELNFSCPNQAGADAAQKSTKLLRSIIKKAKEANEKKALELWEEPRKLVVKIGPMVIGDENPEDLSPEQVTAMAEICDEEGIDGMMVNNTSKNRTGIPKELDPGKGWLSGALLIARSKATIEHLRKIGYSAPIIGLGWVGTGRDAEELKMSSTVLLEAWADYQQMVTWLLLSPLNIVRVNHHVDNYLENNF